MNQTTPTTESRLFYQTPLKLSVLENLARYEVLTSRDLADLIYGDTDHAAITTINQTLESLDLRHRLVNRIFFRPDYYKGRGNLPNASGLSKQGVATALDRWPATYPKEFAAEHSPHTIEHELKRARTHIQIQKLCEKNDWTLGWRKGDIYHLVKPDDLFEITREKTAHFFLEEEHKKKNLDSLYDKFKPYVDFHGTSKFKEAWGFRYFNVIIPMRDAQARDNVLIHFAGGCNCLDPKLRKKHAGSPFRLQSDILWFATHEDITTKTAEKIFYTPRRHEEPTYSFLNQ